MRRRLRRRWRAATSYLRYNVTFRRRVLYPTIGLVGLGLAWILITGYLAAKQDRDISVRLHEVQSLVSQGRMADARALASDLPSMSNRLARLSSGPAWWVASHVPYLGGPVESVRAMSDAAQDVGGHALPILMQESMRLDPSRLRMHGNTISIAPLVQALPGLEKADTALAAATKHIADAPSSTWLSLVDDKRASLAQQLAQLQGYVTAAVRATRVLPTLLGEDGPKTYFIGMQNDAELRGTGGLPGAFAIARVDHGAVRFTRFGSDTVFLTREQHHQLDTGLDFGPDYRHAYGPSGPTSSFVDSNVSPNFPYAARIWAAMWQKVSGQHVDGVLGLDATTLSNFLRVTGPVMGTHHIVVSADNVVSLLGKDEYTIFPSNADRKPFLVSVLRATAHKVTSGVGAAVELLRAASSSASQHRLLAWTQDAATEKVLAESDYAGAIPVTDQPFSGLVLNNASGGKLDYYLSRSVEYQRTGCGPRADVLVTVKLTNNAPAGGLPQYVTGRYDPAPAGARVGDYKTLLDYYATKGAELQSVTLNGDPATVSVEHGLGHPIFRMEVELRRGESQTLMLHLTEPRGSRAPIQWIQPGVTPVVTAVEDQPC